MQLPLTIIAIASEAVVNVVVTADYSVVVTATFEVPRAAVQLGVIVVVVQGAHY